MNNPILTDIKENQISFMLATIATNPINQNYNTKVSDDEIGYLALHIASAMENNAQQKRNILIVCGSGNASAQIMKTQIEKKYMSQISSLSLTDLSKLKLYKLDNFDFIVSSVPIKEKNKTPIVYVDVIFKQQDFLKIDDAIKVSDFTEIDSIFTNSIFIKDIDIKDMSEALDILSNIVAKKTNLSFSTIKQQYLEREEMAFTSYGNIALPHIFEQVDGDSFSIILIPRKKIKWNENNVKIIFSLIIGNTRGDLSIYYDKLGDYLNNFELIKKSSEANNIKEFQKIFLKGAENG